jgi:hypothetical protein
MCISVTGQHYSGHSVLAVSLVQQYSASSWEAVSMTTSSLDKKRLRGDIRQLQQLILSVVI